MKPTSPTILPCADAPHSLPFITRSASVRSLRVPTAEAQEAAAYQGLQALLAHVPVATYLLRGPTYVIELVNAPAAAAWGRPVDQVQGRPFFEALPYLRRQGYEAAYATVWQTQQAVSWREAPITSLQQPAGQVVLGYFDVSFQPFHDGQGHLRGILVTSQEVTEQVRARQRIHQAAAALTASTAGLAGYAAGLTQAIRVAQSHAKFRADILAQLLEQAPIAAGLFVGADYLVEVCNPSLRALWGGLPAQVLHRPLFEVQPESKRQGFRELLGRVGRTGKPSVAHHLPGQVGVALAPVAFIYYPLRDAQARTIAIAAVATTDSECGQAPY